MPSGKHQSQPELEAGPQPYCQQQTNPRNLRTVAAIAGIFLLIFGLATGLTASQCLSLPQGERLKSIYTSKLALLKRGSPATTLWQPAVGVSWNYQLSASLTPGQLRKPTAYSVWGLDLFDTPVSTIDTIQKSGSKVICYFSAGSFETWRSDASSFLPADKGAALVDYPDENWLQTNSANVRKIMKKRLDLAKSKGCSAVDPDNVDGYNNANGVGLTQRDAINYVTFLAAEASKRGLSMGLKNALEIVPSVISKVQFSVNEACSDYNECEKLVPFIQARKPVFNVEYPKDDVIDGNNVIGVDYSTACKNPIKARFSKIIKNIDLGIWIQKCL